MEHPLNKSGCSNVDKSILQQTVRRVINKSAQGQGGFVWV